ncbi:MULTISPECIES: hypothetical protein [unclassified Shewanella]|uniref:hypothetical protein n=1 Tax=unclassified Shewanella TaxID=196818 RepID=UPI001BC53673|nr:MULTISPECIES: hypothetical protein [unclassified Shewanella]GIU11436.1 hypothetical protein TUM4444_17380 [Shewanella sp. MBTL60-112-B1]GIU31175.1 hypothetical protein TUM4445_15360 [Shewanella sp. MBTL60-112-B2]
MTQQRFVGASLAILVYLTVLNFFNEYWHWVSIESFSVSLVAALLLLTLLKLSIKTEHMVAAFFKAKPGRAAKVYRGISTYIILVGSKFMILEAINVMFDEKVSFSGPFNGVVAFFAVVFTILIAEFAVGKIYTGLNDTNKLQAA